MAKKEAIVKLSDEFAKDLEKFRRIVTRWTKEGRKRLLKAHRRIGIKHQAEAMKRVPVETGRLRQAILTNVFTTNDGYVTETGTNIQEYPGYLEFGTRFIAGGAVLALGDDPQITDAQAVHDWPAKNANAIEGTSNQMDSAGGAAGRLRNARGQFLPAKPQEQMPWLRPAWMVIRTWAIAEIDAAYEPPRG